MECAEPGPATQPSEDIETRHPVKNVPITEGDDTGADCPCLRDEKARYHYLRGPGVTAPSMLARQLPLQPREPCIIAIEGDPFATPFDRERREPGIRDL